MPEHVSNVEWAGAGALALAVVAWVVGRGLLRRGRRTSGPLAPRPAVLPALPRQRRSGPALESVELTPAERDAFARLVRRLADGH